MRFRFWIPIGGLALVSVLSVLGGAQDAGAWFQSPLSTVEVPNTPGSFVSPLSLAGEGLADLFGAPVWSSLWLWVTIGLILFGGLALGLIRLARGQRLPE
jgi:hypothetical protein